MDAGLLVTVAGLFVAGLAAVLGIWMERDREGTPVWAVLFSLLIMAAMVVEMGRAWYEELHAWKLEEDMARVLEKLDELAASGENPALAEFVNAEVALQSRANPKVMKKVETRMNARGASLKGRSARGMGGFGSKGGKAKSGTMGASKASKSSGKAGASGAGMGAAKGKSKSAESTKSSESTGSSGRSSRSSSSSKKKKKGNSKGR